MRQLLPYIYQHRVIELTGKASKEEGSQTSYPIVVLPDGQVLERPDILDLADRLGITELPESETTSSMWQWLRRDREDWRRRSMLHPRGYRYQSQVLLLSKRLLLQLHDKVSGVVIRAVLKARKPIWESGSRVHWGP